MNNLILKSLLLESQISAFLEGNNLNENPNFLQWFGKSKVVNKDGTPKVVYHGTPTGGFSSFDVSEWGVNTGHDARGFYFTDKKGAAMADTYSGVGEGSATYPVYLSLQRPYVVDFKGYSWDEDIPKHNGGIDSVVDFAVSNGYDGVIAKNIQDLGGEDTFPTSNDEYGEAIRLLLNRIRKGTPFKTALKETIKDVTNELDRMSDPYRSSMLSKEEKANKSRKLEELLPKLSQLNPNDFPSHKGTSGSGTIYVAFQPNQIKSIYNNGQFSSSTDNISEEEIEENITGSAGFIQGHMYEEDSLDEESSGMGEHYAPNTAYTFWQN